MSQRKPSNLSFESWIEMQILDALERGEFTGLEGEGKPIADIDRPRDELWWVRQKLHREQVDYVPPALAIRKVHDDALRRAMVATSEAEIRSILEPVNADIRYLNSHTVSGPPTTVAPIDVDEFVDRWRASRPVDVAVEPAPEQDASVLGAPDRPGRRRFSWGRRRA